MISRQGFTIDDGVELSVYLNEEEVCVRVDCEEIVFSACESEHLKALGQYLCKVAAPHLDEIHEQELRQLHD